jgi:hypothetical protein
MDNPNRSITMGTRTAIHGRNRAILHDRFLADCRVSRKIPPSVNTGTAIQGRGCAIVMIAASLEAEANPNFPCP